MAEEMLLINPRKRRTRRRKTTAKRRATPKRRTVARRNPTRRRRATRVRRNPAPRRTGVMGRLNTTMMPAAQGAAGAIGLDILMGYIPLPATLATGPARHLVKGVGAVGLGVLAGMVAKSKTANAMTQGALTVVMHDAAKEVISTTMPGIKMGYVNSGFPADGMGMYLGMENNTVPQISDQSGNSDMGAYLNTDEYSYEGSY